MGQKKMGRPTDNPKETIFKVRLDKGTVEALAECAQELNVSKAEIIRRGDHIIHDSLK